MNHEIKHIIKQLTTTVERKITRLYTDKVNPQDLWYPYLSFLLPKALSRYSCFLSSLPENLPFKLSCFYRLEDDAKPDFKSHFEC